MLSVLVLIVNRQAFLRYIILAEFFIVCYHSLISFDVSEEVDHDVLIDLAGFNHEALYLIDLFVLVTQDVLVQRLPSTTNSYHTNCSLDHEHLQICSYQITSWTHTDDRHFAT